MERTSDSAYVIELLFSASKVSRLQTDTPNVYSMSNPESPVYLRADYFQEKPSIVFLTRRNVFC